MAGLTGIAGAAMKGGITSSSSATSSSYSGDATSGGISGSINLGGASGLPWYVWVGGAFLAAAIVYKINKKRIKS